MVFTSFCRIARFKLNTRLRHFWRALAASSLLVAMAGFAAGPEIAGAEKPAAGFSREQDLAFLRKLTQDVIEASRVRPGGSAGGSPTNSLGFTVIIPGGNGGYPAFWVRDFSMSLASGFIAPGEMLDQLRLVARSQNGPAGRSLKHGLIVPPFAIPDHINLDGGAVFYPGTYSATDDQGDGTYGLLPPADDDYEFVHIAYCLWHARGGTNFLLEQINGLPLLERLAAAFDAPQIEARSGLVETDAARRAVGFGFYDGVYFTGRMLFPSLLRYRAAGELAEIFQALGKPERVKSYREIQERTSANLLGAFAEPARLGGWLMAATKVGRQADVWGTLYALHLGVLKEPAASAAAQTIAAAVHKQTINFEGAVRHVPTDMDFSPASAWERTAGLGVNTYQNGAYWHTATGWLIEAVQRTDPKLAAELTGQYIQHLRKNDFRLGGAHGAPWECFNQSGYSRNAAYMTSVTLPYAVLSEMRP